MPGATRMSLASLLTAPYLWFCIAAAALLAPVVAQLPWQIDLGVHAAVIQHWRESAVPGNPLIKVPGPSPYYSPYMFALTALAQLTHASVFTVLRLAAGANVVLFLAGMGLFVRRLTANRWAAPVAVLASVLVWGQMTTLWSGFIVLPSVLVGLPFPSFFGLGLTLVLWALLVDGTRRSFWWPRQVLLAVLAAILLLSHQFSAAGAAVGAVVIVGSSLVRSFSWPRAASWCGTAALAATLTLLWPYYSILDLVGQGGAFDDLTAKLYTEPLLRYGLLGLSLPALLVRLRRDRLDPLVWTAALCALTVVLGEATDRMFLVRLIPYAALPAQVALAVEAVDGLGRSFSGAARRRTRLVVAAAATVALTAGGVAQAGVVNVYAGQLTPPAYEAVFKPPYRLWGDYDWAARHIPADDVVLTDDFYATRMLPAYGVYTVAPAYPDPLLTDEIVSRKAATAEFLDRSTGSDRRTALLQAYDAHWVIAARSSWRPAGAEQAQYEIVADNGRGVYLYRCTP